MPNILRGEASFAVGDKIYRLVVDFNAFAEAEDAAGMDIDALLKAVSPAIDAVGDVLRRPRVKHVGALLFGALQANHPDVTLRDAINLMGEGEQVGEALARAIQGAMPPAVQSAEGKAKAPAAGTGTKPRPTGRKRG